MEFRKRLLILGTLDACIVAFSVVAVYLLRFEFSIPREDFRIMPLAVLFHVGFYLLFFNHLKLYRSVLQYAGIGEVIAIVKAATLAEVSVIILTTIMGNFIPEINIPRSIYTSWALIILSVGGTRFAWRMLRDTYLKDDGKQKHRNVLIIGAGKSGVLIAKELMHSKDHHYKPVAFVDDDRRRHRLELMGIPVIGGRREIHNIVTRYEIEDIVIAMPSISRKEIAKIIDICKTTKATIKTLPRVEDLINGKVSVNMIREVQVEELLGREPIRMDIKEIASYVTGEVVLITGAGGSIGSELCRQVLPFFPSKLLLLGHGENSIYEIEVELRKAFPEATLISIIADIQDRERIEHVFAKYRPEVVFHAAAHKHVPMMEHNPIEAIKNNVFGTKNVAECASAYEASHFVMISTDKAVNPTNVMGATKRLAEVFIQGLNRMSNTKFVTVRFGNVLGSRGSVIPAFKKQIQAGGPVEITHPDMVRYFMTIPEAVQLTIQAGALANGGEIFVLDMGEPIKIVNMARDLISLSGLVPEVDIQIVYTGIRPGEKLYEELLTEHEEISATKHERIFISNPDNFSWVELRMKMEMLESVLSPFESKKSEIEVGRLLFELLPEYRGESQKYN